MDKILIDLFTTRFGGPYGWAKELSKKAEVSGDFSVHVHNRTPRLLASPIWASGDIVHSVIPIAWHLWRKPVVMTVKGDFTNEQYLWKHLYPRAIRRADVVTVPSEFLRERLSLPNAQVIPNAIDLAKYPVVKRAEREILRLVCVTKFWFREKAEGVVQLITHVGKVASFINRNFELSIVGDGPYLRTVKDACANTKTKVHFVGSGDVKSFLYDSDVFLYYSLHDNMPNAVLEAMAASLPVVTNRVGAIGEMITDTYDGFIAENDKEYTDKLAILLTDTASRLSLGQRARQTIEKKFNWDNLIHEYLTIYKRLVK